MIIVSIWCDGPGCTTTTSAAAKGQGLDHRDIEGVRLVAAEHGWVRLRPAGSTAVGDYCPRCAAAMVEKAWERAGVEATNAR